MGTHEPLGSTFPCKVLQLPLLLACCLKKKKLQLQMLLFSLYFLGSAVVPVTMLHMCRGIAWTSFALGCWLLLQHHN